MTHEVKQQRLARLQALLDAQARAISQRDGRQRAARAGRAALAQRTRAQLAGQTENNRWVNFDGPADAASATSRTCVITEAQAAQLRGRLHAVPALRRTRRRARIASRA